MYLICSLGASRLKKELIHPFVMQDGNSGQKDGYSDGINGVIGKQHREQGSEDALQSRKFW